MKQFLLAAMLLLCPVLAQAEPVDTRQFGFIRPGMLEAEVMQRLGEPDTRRVVRRYVLSRVYKGIAESDIREEVLLIYQGNSQIMTTYILLDNGRVVSTDKRR